MYLNHKSNHCRKGISFMRKRCLFTSVVSLFCNIMYILAISCYVSLPTATAQPNEDSLRRPHGKLFYLYSKNVPIDTHNKLLKARELIDSGADYPLAIAILDQIIAVQNDNAEAYLLRAIAYTVTNKFDEAEEDYKNALRLEPENPTFYKYRGQSFLMWQDYAEQKGIDYGWDGLKPNRLALAERMYKKALEIEPYYIDGIVGLGDTYARMGKWGKKKFVRNPPKAIAFYEQAIAEYNKVLALFPGHGLVIAKKQDAQGEIEAITNAEQEAERKRAIEERIR